MIPAEDLIISVIASPPGGQFGGDCWRDLPGFYTKRLKLYRETARTGIVHHGACSKPTPLVALDERKAAGCSSAW